MLKPLAIAAGLNIFIFIAEIFGGIRGHSNSLEYLFQNS